jgi:hypothetical protein
VLRLAKLNKTKVTPSTAVTAGAVVTITLVGSKSVLWVISGNVWIDLNGRSDLTTLNGFKLTANTTMDLETSNIISFISDAAGAAIQIMEWGVI